MFDSITRGCRRCTGLFVGALACAVLTPLAAAQDIRLDPPANWIEERAEPRPSPAARRGARALTRNSTADGGAFTNNIMITGYWPPTNEMIRRFSDDPTQNPAGWVGGNWEGRGYDIYAFFPEFPGGVLARGVGDFEVDYQDTSNDWWPLVQQLQPVAIITFSRANTQRGWELEGGHRKYDLSLWTVDYLAPTRPTPELPIASEPNNNERFSSLPMQAIVNAVDETPALVDPFIAPFDEGRFLSNYIGYHGCWYHDLHAAPSDPAWNVAAGHIHVGQNTALPDAVSATETTLRVLIDVVNRRLGVVAAPADMNCDGLVNFDDITGFVLALTDPSAYAAAIPACRYLNADTNDDGLVNFDDLNGFVQCLTGACP